MKCLHCDNPSVYEILTVDGETVHVCEECDEDYSSCQICGKADIHTEMSFANETDELRTCHICHKEQDEEIDVDEIKAIISNGGKMSKLLDEIAKGE
jgi:hypothetical protein